MKILMVLMGLDIGGAETHVVELSRELARRGNEITVVSNGGVFTAELKAAGIRHIQLPLHSREIRKMLTSYIGLKKLLKSESFDVVHAHARIPGFICGMLHKKLKFRFITTTHWVFKTGPLLNLMTNWGERTIAVSDDIKSYLIENYGLRESHITVTINGIDTNKFSPGTDPSDVVAEFGLGNDTIKAVYVSRMDRDRSAAAFNLIEITPLILKKHENFELVIVGGGNDFERLKKAADECNEGIGRRVVTVTGARTDINKFTAAADVFIGVSRAVLEAMAAAKPVIIAGNEGYIGLFGKDKLQIGIETNFCCRGCNATENEALYNDMLEVLGKTKEQRAEMGTFNRGVILDLYSEKRMADDCERAYSELLSADPQRPDDIIISGYYGYNNTGDDSLLYAVINSLKDVKPNVGITVLSAKPAETKRIYGVGSIHRYNIFKIAGAMRRAKLLISGGGSLVQDVTSTKSLLYYLYIIKSAKRRGMKVMVYASGIGPINSRNNRSISGRVLSCVDLITLREPASYDELKSLNADKPPVYVTTDPAFALCKADSETINDILKKENIDTSKKYFIVSIRPWKKADSGFHEKIAVLCDYICKKYNMTALFVPMQPSNDIPVNMRIISLMKSKGIILKGEYSAQELIGIIERARLVIGMRLHVLIYAAVACVPVFGLSYDPKVDSMLSYLRQHYKENVENASAERMKKGVDEILNNEESIRGTLKKGAESMRGKTRQDAEYAIKLLDSLK